jgi:glycosyltransferase involved in cell wall biosynthesis
MHILHIIVGLNRAGAELMLNRLVIQMRTMPNIIQSVISLTDLGVLGADMRRKGINIYSLDIDGALNVPRKIIKLIRFIKEIKPDVVQTWMYHADLIGGVAARLAGVTTIFWGIRSVSIPQGAISFTYWLIRLCSICSRFIPLEIICCANSARDAHLKMGYDEKKITVIPNGYDFTDFRRTLHARIELRRELGFREDETVIGVVGRFDPQKDYRNFIASAFYLKKTTKDLKFLMIGKGNDGKNKVLLNWLDDFNLRGDFKLVGEQSNMPLYFSVMDIFCLSSKCEAFPNVVAEAMAMSLPCVVTNVGDAGAILSNYDYVVPAGNPIALAERLNAICSLDSETRISIGNRNAKIVKERYSIGKIAELYYSKYAQACQKVKIENFSGKH